MSKSTRQAVAKTHAEASRERRDIVSGEVMDEARLIRFVAGPDGSVVPDLVERLLRQRVLSGLGLARRAGDLTSGFEKVSSAISSGKAAWLIEASDGAADGRRKILAQARKAPRPLGLLGLFDAAELGLALGLENVIHTAFLAGRAAERWTDDVRRLEGFCPLLPEDWREEPDEAKREP